MPATDSPSPVFAGVAAAPLPYNEAQRLAALASYGILDMPREPACDDAAMPASAVCRTPLAAVSFIDAERQWPPRVWRSTPSA